MFTKHDVGWFYLSFVLENVPRVELILQNIYAETL